MSVSRGLDGGWSSCGACPRRLCFRCYVCLCAGVWDTVASLIWCGSKVDSPCSVAARCRIGCCSSLRAWFYCQIHERTCGVRVGKSYGQCMQCSDVYRCPAWRHPGLVPPTPPSGQFYPVNAYRRKIRRQPRISVSSHSNISDMIPAQTNYSRCPPMADDFHNPPHHPMLLPLLRNRVRVRPPQLPRS